MIKSFNHKVIKAFFESGSTAGIQAQHVDKLRLQLSALDQAKKPEDMSAPGWRLHPLHNKGKTKLKGHFGITVSGNWRLTFMFDGEDAVLVDYMDYH